ncbi:putative zinc metalloproteinase nas-36 [Trichinella spiralis]|uniref:putative zinc metalloproteinase nas-36 n=1 Tax=Trichinella spiralis TaxID=6334 RepID=UPI0001EFCE57|nr:putative zinc metalloproteinase nas-36 [Trichinella spiralis]
MHLTSIWNEMKEHSRVSKDTIQANMEFMQKLKAQMMDTSPRENKFRKRIIVDKSDERKPFENSELFQTDVMLSKSDIEILSDELLHDKQHKKSRSSTRSGIIKDLNNRWPTVIPYKFESNATVEDEKNSPVNESQVELGLKWWEEHTCLTFVRNDNPSEDTDYLTFIDDEGCWSYIGKQGGRQEVSLPGYCSPLYVVTHEVAHALGLHHTQNRPDRDRYVYLNHTNIKSSKAYNYRLTTFDAVDVEEIPYDYQSVMHYPSKGFALDNNYDVIISRDPLYATSFGYREEPSFYDIKLVNKHYCSAMCYLESCSHIRNKCKNGGYPNPKYCNTCICPSFFEGEFCQNVKRTDDPNCGQHVIKPTSTPYKLNITGRADCIWKVKVSSQYYLASFNLVPKGHTIQFWFYKFEFSCNKPCTDHYFGIKYKKDMAYSMALLCCDNPGTIQTEGNVAILKYSGTWSTRGIELYMRQNRYKYKQHINDNQDSVRKWAIYRYVIAIALTNFDVQIELMLILSCTSIKSLLDIFAESNRLCRNDADAR